MMNDELIAVVDPVSIRYFVTLVNITGSFNSLRPSDAYKRR